MMKSWASARRAAALDFGIGGAGPADADVLGDRAVEEASLLEHNADGLAQRGQRQRRDGLPVDQDAALLRIADALQQGQRRGLAGAGRADQGHGLARPRRQVEVEDALRCPGHNES